MRVVVTCHVEFGYATTSVFFDKRETKGAVEGIRNAIEIADQYNAKISFAIMPEVLEAIARIDFGNHEVGLHIHPDDMFLMKRGFGGKGDLRDYGLDEQRDMMSEGRKAIEDVLCVSPRIFVSGNWSVNNDTIQALGELGFTHDGSPCPGLMTNRCDWRKLPRICMPYHPSQSDYQLSGSTGLVMVPVSKLIRGGVVSPENNIGPGFLKAAFEEYRQLSLPVFHISLHSPSMTSHLYRKVFSQLLKHVRNLEDFSLLSDVEPVKEISFGARCLPPYLRNLDASAIAHILGHSFRQLGTQSIRWPNKPRDL